MDFLSKELLGPRFSYEEYVKNYSEVKPSYLYCYLIHQRKQDIWTFALWEGDKAGKADIEKAYRFLTESFYIGTALKFRPTSTFQEEVSKTLDNIPVITNDELFRNSDYQLLNSGISIGILRISTDTKQQEYSDDEIIILPELIPDITPVAGIITEQFSTPLSHLALRARTWQIPHAGIKEASQLYKHLEGHSVYFEATASSYTLRKATDEEVAVYKDNRKKPSTVVLAKANLSERRLKPLQLLRRSDHISYGTKAANLGECFRLNNISIPSGFAIPFYYYNKHIADCGADIEHTLANLQTIRDKILNYPLDKQFLDQVWSLLPSPSVFVRSSTNAEDLAGFNGAGLYDTVANVTTIESLEHAIKTVWASIWSQKAFKERERYGIDHASVYGAILVQTSLDAQSAGVLVTKDIFDPTETMEVYTINASHGLGASVVEGVMIPEQIIYNFDNKGIKILSRASGGTITIFDENGGTKTIPNPYDKKPVLTDEQITTLGNATNRILRLYRAQYPLDIEWLFKDNQLYILQVRPFL